EAAGLRYILHRSGAILQDISSRPYRVLEAGFRATYSRHKLPQVFIGGHEHSLQVLDGVNPLDPPTNLVSGSASKISELAEVPGLAFGQSAPGYIRMLIERGGRVSFYVEAAPSEYLHCPADEPDRSTCLSEGVAAFRTVF